jgi:hypothetical protein
MSNLFSYELDEAQIRSTLQKGGAVEPMESAWDEFDANFGQNTSNQSAVKFKLPEFNLNINRNIVLPTIFIAGLVGVSAIMLSFIDFKENTPKQVEKALIPDAGNYRNEEAKAATLIPKKEPEKKVEQPVVKTPSVEVKAEPQPIQNTPAQVVIQTPQTTQNTATPLAGTPVQNTQRKVTTDTGSVNNKTDNQALNTINQSYPGKSRKRRRKVTNDQIEAIKAPSILGVETTKKEEEPELEIKLN